MMSTPARTADMIENTMEAIIRYLGVVHIYFQQAEEPESQCNKKDAT